MFVYWGYGKQVFMNDGRGLDAIMKTWDMRGFIYRFFRYVDYLFASTIAGNVFTLQAQFFYKLFGVAMLFILLYLAVMALPGKFLGNLKRLELFCLSAIGLLAVHFASHFQAEMPGVFLIILATSIYLRNTVKSSILAGLVIGLSFFWKSPLPLMGGSVYFASLLLTDQKFKNSLKYISIAALSAFLVIGIVLLYFHFYNNQEIVDIINASYYQHTLLHELTVKRFCVSLCAFARGFFPSMLYKPVVCLGVVASVIVLITFIKRRKYHSVFYVIGMWAFPMFYIMLSNCYWAYHYYLMIYPSFVMLALLTRETEIVSSKAFMYGRNVLVIALGLFYVVYLSAISPYSITASKEYQEYITRTTQEARRITDEYQSANILYLDDGHGAFLFPAKSYCRYLYPLPIQRIKKDNPFIDSDTYKDTNSYILSYDGKIITLMDEWFFFYCDHEDIRSKIDTEYHLSTTFDAAYFTWDLFGERLQSMKLKVYVRNQ
jgi:hypothetical protein